MVSNPKERGRCDFIRQGAVILPLKAFVTIAVGYTHSNRLEHEIKAILKANLSAERSLTEIAFTEPLPITKRGETANARVEGTDLGLTGGDASSW
jgi:acyl-coenzyme A synthetase/AMP-(fatty) acid ligase